MPCAFPLLTRPQPYRRLNWPDCLLPVHWKPSQLYLRLPFACLATRRAVRQVSPFPVVLMNCALPPLVVVMFLQDLAAWALGDESAPATPVPTMPIAASAITAASIRTGRNVGYFTGDLLGRVANVVPPLYPALARIGT